MFICLSTCNDSILVATSTSDGHMVITIDSLWLQKHDNNIIIFEFSELNGKDSSQINEISDDLKESPKPKDVRRELIMLSLPAIGGQVIEPMVQLMETAYIGHLGKVYTFMSN